MSPNYKEQIRAALVEAVRKGSSHAKISKESGVSESMLSHIKNGNWDNYSNGVAIPENVLRNLAKFLGLGEQVVETMQYLEIHNLLLMAKEHSLAAVVDGSTGLGKTFTIKRFAASEPRATYVVTCARDFTAKRFVMAVAHAVGAETVGTQYELRVNIRLKLAQDVKPLLILDEAENLSDQNYQVIKALYDALEGRCGIVLVGANQYWEMLSYKSKKRGYSAGCFPQLVSRFRANVLTVSPITHEDAAQVCEVFGVKSKAEARQWWQKSEDYRALFGGLKRAQLQNQINQVAL